MILKNRLKELRARDGLNQSELAKLAGVSRQSISLLERGEYTPLTLEEGVEWSADALEVFQEKEIPVIRLGLNPSRELEEQALAGVYHPALGQLVQSRILHPPARLPYIIGRASVPRSKAKKMKISGISKNTTPTRLSILKNFPNRQAPAIWPGLVYCGECHNMLYCK